MPKIDIGGTRLHYEIRGAGGEVVALLNGIAMSVANWKPIAEALSPDHRVLCHDFRGQMLSDRPGGPYSLRGHADDLAALMEALDIADAHLVGTSYGGEVAMEFALAYPERTRSLVLVDSVSYADPLLRSAVEGWKAAALADPIAFYRGIIPWNYSAEFIGKNLETLRSREAVIAALPRDWFEAFAALCDAFLAIDLRGRLAAIPVPTLVIYGGKDILKGEAYSTSIASEIPGALLRRIPGSGHAVVIEDPEALLSELEFFLSRVARNQAPGA
jgi:3-oxoadipate enol-lactonase